MYPSQPSAAQVLGLPLPACSEAAKSMPYKVEERRECFQENEALMIKAGFGAMHSLEITA